MDLRKTFPSNMANVLDCFFELALSRTAQSLPSKAYSLKALKTLDPQTEEPLQGHRFTTTPSQSTLDTSLNQTEHNLT